MDNNAQAAIAAARDAKAWFRAAETDSNAAIAGEGMARSIDDLIEMVRDTWTYEVIGGDLLVCVPEPIMQSLVDEAAKAAGGER